MAKKSNLATPNVVVPSKPKPQLQVNSKQQLKLPQAKNLRISVNCGPLPSRPATTRNDPSNAYLFFSALDSKSSFRKEQMPSNSQSHFYSSTNPSTPQNKILSARNIKPVAFTPTNRNYPNFEKKASEPIISTITPFKHGSDLDIESSFDLIGFDVMIDNNVFVQNTIDMMDRRKSTSSLQRKFNGNDYTDADTSSKYQRRDSLNKYYIKSCSGSQEPKNNLVTGVFQPKTFFCKKKNIEIDPCLPIDVEMMDAMKTQKRNIIIDPYPPKPIQIKPNTLSNQSNVKPLMRSTLTLDSAHLDDKPTKSRSILKKPGRERSQSTKQVRFNESLNEQYIVEKICDTPRKKALRKKEIAFEEVLEPELGPSDPFCDNIRRFSYSDTTVKDFVCLY
jgi:hypothetical protein